MIGRVVRGFLYRQLLEVQVFLNQITECKVRFFLVSSLPLLDHVR